MLMDRTVVIRTFAAINPIDPDDQIRTNWAFTNFSGIISSLFSKEFMLLVFF